MFKKHDVVLDIHSGRIGEICSWSPAPFSVYEMMYTVRFNDQYCDYCHLYIYQSNLIGLTDEQAAMYALKRIGAE